MWRNKDTHIHDIYKHQLHENITNSHNENIKLRKTSKSSNYNTGLDSDNVVNKNDHSYRASIITIETSNNIEEEILILRRRVVKRGQLEALLKHTSIIKKRKTEDNTKLKDNSLWCDSQDPVYY